jgi:hypothetical protein
VETKDAIRIARAAGYKKYDSPARSYASRTRETGVQHVPALLKLFGAQEAAGARTRPSRKDTARISCWVSEALRGDFNASKAKRGYKTDRDYVCFLIAQDALVLEKECAASGQHKKPNSKLPGAKEVVKHG